MANPNHHICIHGHFYQPPRENPWLGVVEEQESAAPHHDWNERIAAECYEPNTCTPLRDDEGAIGAMRNNFTGLSFNAGATLLDWMRRKRPDLHARILEADRWNVDHCGRGNAIAQAYGHAILPLANARDLRTQVLWGIRHFQHTFGRWPEGMWLPECAVDRRTVTALIEAGIRFIILAPDQASRIRHFHDQHWREVYGIPLDTRHAYRVFDRTPAGRKDYTRHLDAFFFDGAASHGFAFGGWLGDRQGLARRLLERLDEEASWPQLASVATDGETFGHHHRDGVAALARLMEDLRAGSAQLDTYARFLAECPPLFEAELYEGNRGEGSSWSCKHGVDRWIRDCGCADGGPPEWSQAWRTPLRTALDRLRDRLDEIFEAEGAPIFLDPWEARERYIEVLCEPGDDARAAFLAAHAPRVTPGSEAATRAWALLEMQRHAMLMYASCGWFFADINGIEPVQNLRCALRAIERAAPFCEDDLEVGLITDLEAAKSNQPEEPTGADVYRAHVRKTRYGADAIAACFALRDACGLPAPPFADWRAEIDRVDEPLGGWLEGRASILWLEDSPVGRTTLYATLSCTGALEQIVCLVVHCEDRAAARRQLDAWARLEPDALGQLLQKEGIGLVALPNDERGCIHASVARRPIAEAAEALRTTYEDLRPVLAAMARNGVRPVGALQAASRSVLEDRLCALVDRPQTRHADPPLWDATRDGEAVSLLEEADAFGLRIDRDMLARRLGERIRHYLFHCEEAALAEITAQAKDAVAFAARGDLALSMDLLAAAYWSLLEGVALPLARRCRDGVVAPATEEAALADAAVRAVWSLGVAIGFADDHLDRQLAD
jgi:alpha-amylase/alpha-mannosidase (GH57 family)